MSIFRLIALFATLLTTIWGTLQARPFTTVVIDAGHGGKDIGGNYDKTYEKHLALDTAKRLEFILKKKGFRTRMIRSTDVFLSLQKRASIGNRYRNSIYVSIHYNYGYRKGAKGIETFYYSSRSKPLAKYVHRHMLRKTRATNRRVKYARYYVIRNARNPSILVEGGFLSNSSERRACRRGSYRQKIAEGIAKGIIQYQAARRSGRAR